jgi:hypothetical protein
MRNIAKLFIYTILLCSCAHYNSINMQDKEIDGLFNSWNDATIKSISTQRNSTTQEKEKSLYENRVDALKAYLKLDDSGKINKNSIRYKFLQKLQNTNSDFYIVESNRSGEQVVIRNYVIYPKNNKTMDVVKYELRNNDWIIIKKYVLSNPIEFSFKTNRKIFGSGNNMDDVIITHISNKTITNSDFYLFSTMNTLNLE